MDFSFFTACLGRIWERKRSLILFGALFLCGVILGFLFIGTPSAYDYHFTLCERYLNRICFSDRDVFVIFLERTAGRALLLALILLSGVHFAALIVPSAVLLYRAYTFGGSIVILFSVYRVTGVLVVFVLYLPIHLLIDAVLVGATALSCARASGFCFCRRDFCDLARDFLALFALVALVCLLEMLLLLAVFHPMGTLL